MRGILRTLSFRKTYSTMTTPRVASSLVILRPSEDGEYDYRVLMLQRHSKSSTFENAYVFPGGGLDPADSDPKWDEFFPNTKDKVLRSLKLAALRETFEEGGILVGRGKNEKSQAELSEWREKVHNDATQFINLFTPDFRPAVDLIQHRSNWITPPTQKRRFDTHFFVTVLLPKYYGDVQVVSDGKETVDARWISPLEGVDLCIQNKIILIPPQFYLLSELSQFKRWRDLLEKDDQGRTIIQERKIVAFNPTLRKGPNMLAMVYEGDYQHPRTKELFPDVEIDSSFLNRTYMTPQGSEKDTLANKRPGNELALEGIERRNIGRLLGKNYNDILVDADVVKRIKEKL